MADTRRIDQVYIGIFRGNAAHPPLPAGRDEMMKRHHDYLQDLQDKKILYAAGSNKDVTGERHGHGIIVVRAPSLEEERAPFSCASPLPRPASARPRFCPGRAAGLATKAQRRIRRPRRGTSSLMPMVRSACQKAAWLLVTTGLSSAFSRRSMTSIEWMFAQDRK